MPCKPRSAKICLGCQNIAVRHFQQLTEEKYGIGILALFLTQVEMLNFQKRQKKTSCLRNHRQDSLKNEKIRPFLGVTRRQLIFSLKVIAKIVQTKAFWNRKKNLGGFVYV